MNPIKHINLFTTYRCNSRCMNCFIWKDVSRPEDQGVMTADQMTSLYTDPLFEQCEDIGFAGGEPTISKFFWDVIHRVPKQKRVTITTNALSHRRLVDFLSRTPHPEKYMVQVSVDGIGQVNYRIRGVPGAYQKAVSLLNELKNLNIPRLLSFTINRLNHHQIRETYQLSQSVGAEFGIRMAHSGGAYENQDNASFFELDKAALDRIENALTAVVDDELANPSHQPEKLVFINKMVDYYRGQQADLPCLALETGAVIDLFGDVFPNCPFMMKPIGNLFRQSLSEVWQSEKAQKTRKFIGRLACGGCWNDCQVITNIAADDTFIQTEYESIKLKKLASVPPPPDIDFNRDHSLMLGFGWFDPEGETGRKYRWTQPDFSVAIPMGTTDIEIDALTPEPLISSGPAEVKIQMDNLPIQCFTLSESGWKTYRVSLNTGSDGWKFIRFHLNRSYCPKTSGQSEDNRTLGWAVRHIRIYPEKNV